MPGAPGSNVYPLEPGHDRPTAARIVEIGRGVVAEEAAALRLLAAGLDEAMFVAAVTAIGRTDGRVVVTGMGKSGHVARKAAATLASVGIAALFVHPGEAAHGDLGMIAAGDLLIAFSNSGFTRELAPLLRYAADQRIPVIAITARRRSPLADAAAIHLLLPDVAEAGPARLAPTTSSTMMMALGDALALAAAECRGSSRSRFGALHPAGDLGARLGLVGLLMHTGPAMPLAATDAPMPEVVLLMTQCSLGIAGIVAGGRLVGVVTDGDLRRHIDALMTMTAGEVMTPNPVTIASDAAAEDALALMNEHGITALFVVHPTAADVPVGLVHVHDFVRLGIV